MLYLFDEINRLEDDFPERCIPYLSAERREKVFSYRFPQDRKLSAAVYVLLRLALRENYGINEPVVFTYGKNEKPVLRDHPTVHFNLSHCKCAVACAVSQREVGVDVQEIMPVSDELARRVLTAKEYMLFKAAENPALQFCEYWVMKESLLKKTGKGIAMDLTALSVEGIGEHTLFANENYCGCVAGMIGAIRRIGMPELIEFQEYPY